jgi:hypothetical protein
MKEDYMNKLVRSLFAGAAVSMPLALVAASPASAANVDVAVIQGSGTISPGLGAVPEQQSVQFSGTATVVGTDGVAATYPCNFSGTDLAGSVAEGVGTVSGSCGPISLTTCVFVRVAGVVVVACADGVVEVGGAVCVFTPDDVLPTTSYDLVCAAAYAKAP